MFTLISSLPLLLLGQMFYFSRGTGIGVDLPSKIQFSRRVNSRILRRLVGTSISVHDCAVECGLRSSCTGINYQRMVKECELLENISPKVSPERTKGWVYLEMTDDLKRVIMKQYCGDRDNCPPGQKCSQKGEMYLCSIEECTEPPFASDSYLPNEGKTLHIGAKIRVKGSVSDQLYGVHCCEDGNWARDCSAPTPTPATTTVSTTLSTSTSSTSTSTASTVPTITISEDEWYTLPSESRIRQLASVRTTALNWKSAMSVCGQNGGSLAHVYDEIERELIHEWLAISPMEAQIWVGGRYSPGINGESWSWLRESGAVKSIDSSVWGTGKPDLDEVGQCASLYRDNALGYQFYLMNDFCDLQFSFICERDFTDVTIDEDAWFLVTSSEEKREAVYIGNPSLSWTKAQEVCDKNGGTLAHSYYVGELSLNEQSIAVGERLWVGVKYSDSTGRWYWWQPGSDTDLIVDEVLWSSGVASTATSDCVWLLQRDWVDVYLDTSPCYEENSFLCQRELQVQIPEADWFLLDDDATRLRSVAYVQTPTLSWKQSRDVCERNGGTLVHIYTSSEIQFMIDVLREKNIDPAALIWTGGRYETDTGEWMWWSGLGLDRAVIDTSVLSAGLVDHTVGECVQLQLDAVNISAVYLPSSSLCAEQNAFLCQKEFVYTINEADWFMVNGRKLAYVFQETKRDTAQAICKKNGGTLACALERTETEQILRELANRGLPTQEQIWLGEQFDWSAFQWVCQEDDGDVFVSKNVQGDGSMWSTGVVQIPDRGSEDICIQILNAGSIIYVQNDMCSNKFSFLCQKDQADV